MRKTKILTFITIMVVGITLSCIPALAASLEYTRTTLYFIVQSADEVSVFLVGEGTGTPSGPTGADTTNTLNFTCAATDCSWKNVSISIGGTQTDLVPGVSIRDTGTSNVRINISVNTSLPGAGVTSCLDLRYSNDTYDSTPGNAPAADLFTTNVTLGNLTATTQFNVWLYGNFTGCQVQTTPLAFYVWAYFW